MPPVRRDPEVLEPLEALVLGGVQRVALDDLIEQGPQRAAGHLARVEHPHGPRGGVARVGERLEPLRLALRVERLEVAPVDDDLAPERQAARVPDAKRHAPDRPDVVGDVLAGRAVAPRARLDEPPAVVHHLDARAVELWLDAVARVFSLGQAVDHAPVELRELVRRVGVVEREHPDLALHLGHGRYARLAAHAARGRVGRGKVGVLALDRAELAHEPIELRVREERVVEDVVAVVVGLDLAHEGGMPLGGRHGSESLIMPREPPQPPIPEPSERVGPIVAQLAFVVVAALFVYGFVAVTKEGETRRLCSAPCFLHPDYMAADRRAPDFALKDASGATVTLESLRGKVVVLNFWTKTCGPCLEEMPELAELAKILRDRPDVAVVTVSVDDSPEDVKPTLQTVLHEPPPFQVLFDPGSEVVKGKFGTRLFPETWFVDKRGVIRARFDGAREWTNPLVVNYVDSLRDGDYCAVQIDGRTLRGKAAKVCDDMTGT